MAERSAASAACRLAREVIYSPIFLELTDADRAEMAELVGAVEGFYR